MMTNATRVQMWWAARISSWRAEEGASMIEYALLAALIAMVAIAAVAVMGSALSAEYSTIASSVANT